MDTARKTLIVTTMWVMGLAMLAAFGWLVHVRDSTPVHLSSTTGAAGPHAKPLAVLTIGAAASTSTAADELAAGRRSSATHALEAAHRASEVGYENSHGEAKTAFTLAEKKLRAAGEALHEGRAQVAGTDLRQAARALRQGKRSARGERPDAPPALVWQDYAGAALIDARGSRIGHVERIDAGADTPVAVLQLGGTRDLFGFLDRGGRQVRVPVRALLWGPRRSLGNIWVALPSEKVVPGAST